MIIFDNILLSTLVQDAKKSPRLRQHYNLHADFNEPSQRLLNAVEPRSYIRPHRHLSDPKPESFVGLRGRVALLVFDDIGRVYKIVFFGPREEVLGADIPPGIWHTIVSLEEGSVFYETKPGPFIPASRKDMAPWAPEEGSVDAARYLEFLRNIIRHG